MLRDKLLSSDFLLYIPLFAAMAEEASPHLLVVKADGEYLEYLVPCFIIYKLFVFGIHLDKFRDVIHSALSLI